MDRRQQKQPQPGSNTLAQPSRAEWPRLVPREPTGSFPGEDCLLPLVRWGCGLLCAYAWPAGQARPGQAAQAGLLSTAPPGGGGVGGGGLARYTAGLACCPPLVR